MDTRGRRTEDGRRWVIGPVRLWELAVLLAVGAGCVGPRPQSAAVAPASGQVIELMTARDRAQLAAVSVDRQRGDARDGYRVGPDDLLEVAIPDLLAGKASGSSQRGAALPSVADTPSSDQGLRVNSRGDITLPYLGAVHAEGLTTTELEAQLVKQLRAADLLRNPQVGVRLIEYRSAVVAVMGSVERPGLFPITRPGATMADLIWAAGGPTRDAGRLVSFAPGGSTDPIRVDLETLLQPHGVEVLALNPRVRPGDVISVAPAGQVLVDGWVEKPGAYPVTRGLTLAGAVAAAGGLQYPADQSRVLVKRTVGPSERQTFTVDLRAAVEGTMPDFPLADGDVVNVPVSGPKVVPWSFWKVAREVIHIGGSIPLF